MADAGGSASALIPLERELRERVAWFIGLRRLAAGAMVVGTWVATSVLDVGLAPLPLYAVGLAVAVYNLLFRALSRRPGLLSTPLAYQRFVYAQVGLDWVALGVLAGLTGGIRSPILLGFAFHLIIGAILLPRLACYLQAGLASLLVGLLMILEVRSGWALAPVCDFPLTHGEGLYRWLVISLFLAITAFLTTSIAVPLRRKEEALFASEQALDRAYGEVEALYRMGQAVNATLDLDRVLGIIVENGARLMGMKACSIRLLDGQGKHLRVGAAYGLSQTYLDKGPVEVERSGLDAEALAGEVVQVAEVAADPRFQYPEEAKREGIRAVLCAPMQAKGRSIGCIRIYSAEPHWFTKAEESLLRNLANLGATAIENARAFAAVQALGEERAWFARVTHHQLRAPLAAVQGMLDALRYAGPLSEKQADLVERGRRRVREMLELVRDLLDLAAAQRPRLEQSVEPVPLLDGLAHTLETVRDRAAHKGVLVRFDVPDPEVAVLAEAEDVDRIFANLLDNAVKYTPAGGSVTFAARREGNRVEVAVSDTGIGIGPEDQERVFAGFYRTRAAKESGEVGTGMGLSIVRQLVQRWGGEVTLESAPGEGSRFTVSLPAAVGQPLAPPRADG